MNKTPGLHIVNTREPRNEREATINVKAWPSDRDVAAMLASSGALEGKGRPRNWPRIGFLMVLASAVATCFALGYFSTQLVEAAARLLR